MSTIISPPQDRGFEALMQGSYKKVFSLAYRLSGSRTDAEDLTQEAFFRAYRGFEGYQGDRPFENWIYRIVTRLYLDLRRRQGRRVATISSDAPFQTSTGGDSVTFESPDPGPNPEAILLSESVSSELEASLERLTKEQRQLVLMADVEQMPYNEIAERLKTPVGTIRSRLHRAHKQLRAYLAEIQAARQGGYCQGC